MKLKLKNIGKINSAEIEFNGITVVAGDNNSGKSTIGKILYCIFKSFHNIEAEVHKERQTAVRRIFNLYRNYAKKPQEGVITSIIPLVENIMETDSSRSDLEKLIGEYYSSTPILKDDNQIFLDENVHPELISNIANRVQDVLLRENIEIEKLILRKNLRMELGMNVGHVNDIRKSAEVELCLRDGHIKFEVIGNETVEIDESVNLYKDIVYIDSPFVLDELANGAYGKRQMNYKGDLVKKLRFARNGNEFDVISELIVKEKIQKIIDEINDICEGSLVNEEESFSYVASNLNRPLTIANLSTGIKSFITLKTLLENGNIEENGVVILDEPEIHLHPEWQLKFAEIIVLIQKEFRVNFLINTHSPYFLNAIQAYALKHKIKNKCKYYITKSIDDLVDVADVTDEIEVIYEKMARPFQELKDLEFRYE